MGFLRMSNIQLINDYLINFEAKQYIYAKFDFKYGIDFFRFTAHIDTSTGIGMGQSFYSAYRKVTVKNEFNALVSKMKIPSNQILILTQTTRTLTITIRKPSKWDWLIWNRVVKFRVFHNRRWF